MPKIVTNIQRLANRRNAQSSTGPTTPQGRAKSARNAIKHGLLSTQVVVAEGDGAESPEEFQALLDGLLDEFDPQDVIEQALVQRVATCFWRLRRAQRFEVGALRESLDECRRDHGHSELADIQSELHRAQESRGRLAEYLKFLQAFDPSDPEQVESARPVLEKIMLRFSGDVWQLPVPKICEVLLRKLPDYIKAIDEQEIPEIERRLEEARKYDTLRLQRQALAAALPAPEQVLRLVRYETMLDRQLHRALTQLQRRRSPKRVLQTATDEP